MLHRRRHRIRPKGLLAQLAERLLGSEQSLIAGGERFPVILANYPRGRRWFAQALESALRSTFPTLPAALRADYESILGRMPCMVVVDLRRRNICSCLGHNHPPPSDGPLTRRLALETGARVGEIDLAVEAIRDWSPLTLSSLAAEQFVPPADSESRETYTRLRFHSALLSVFLHELEHLAFPDRAEDVIRRRSDAFYLQALQHLLADEFGASFGIVGELAASAS